jgi:hypothetical protein
MLPPIETEMIKVSFVSHFEDSVFVRFMVDFDFYGPKSELRLLPAVVCLVD